MPRKVYITMQAFKNMCEFSAQYASNYLDRKKWVESMGYLFCRQDGPKYLIGDAVGMSRGGETFVTMTPDDLAKIEQLEKDHPEDFLGGWWHTHPGLSPFFSDTDVQNQMFYQAQNEDGLGLVFDHSMVSSKFVGFKIFRLDNAQDPLTKYHDVKWTPLNWTEKGLSEALKPIGISHRVIQKLAYNLKIRNSPPEPELPPFRMPNISNDAMAQKMLDNTNNSSSEAYAKGDILQALMSKRVHVALLQKYEKDLEIVADEIIIFIEWCLENDKFLTANKMLEQLELLIEDSSFSEDLINYYTGKLNYYRGKVNIMEFRYSNAIEFFEKSIPPLEQEETYDEECSSAAENIAKCYEKQKEYKQAIVWLKKSIQFITQAISFNEENKEDEEDEEYIDALQKKFEDLKRYLKRLEIMQSALSTGPERIV